MRNLILVLFFCSCLITAKAEGFQVNAQSQKSIAMGHTGVGLLMGAASVHFNPGALSFLAGTFDFSMGSTLVFSDVAFSKQGSTYQTNTNSSAGTPLYFYGASRLNEKVVLSFGITTPYGNSLSWESDWDGRYLIQDISFKAIVLQPTISYKVNEKLGVGGGLMIATGSVNLNKALPIANSAGESSVNLKGSTTSVGFNGGVFYKMSEAFSLGLNYRSKMLMKMNNGDAKFNVPTSLSTSFPAKNSFNAELPLPSNLTIGAGYKVNKKLKLAADLQFVNWSAYESLNFDFANNTEALQDSYNTKNFSNTFIYRIGAEYNLSKSIALRAGVYYDETPVNKNLLNPETPGMNKIGLSTGASITLKNNISLDLSLVYITGIEREAGYEPLNFYGTYNSKAILPGVGISYSF